MGLSTRDRLQTWGVHCTNICVHCEEFWRTIDMFSLSVRTFKILKTRFYSWQTWNDWWLYAVIFSNLRIYVTTKSLYVSHDSLVYLKAGSDLGVCKPLNGIGPLQGMGLKKNNYSSIVLISVRCVCFWEGGLRFLMYTVVIFTFGCTAYLSFKI